MKKRRFFKKKPVQASKDWMAKSIKKVERKVNQLVKVGEGMQLYTFNTQVLKLTGAATALITPFIISDPCNNSQGFQANLADNTRTGNYIVVKGCRLQYQVVMPPDNTAAANGLTQCVRVMLIRFEDSGTGAPNSATDPTLWPAVAMGVPGGGVYLTPTDLFNPSELKDGIKNDFHIYYDRLHTLTAYDRPQEACTLTIRPKHFKINKKCIYNSTGGGSSAIQSGRIVLIAFTDNGRAANAGGAYLIGSVSITYENA